MIKKNKIILLLFALSAFIFNIIYVNADTQTLGATWSKVCFDTNCSSNETFYQGQGRSDIDEVVPVIYFYFYGDYNSGTQKFNKDTLYTLSINFSLYLVGEERPVNASEISSLFSEYEFGAGVTGVSDMSGSLIKIQNYGFYNGANNSVEFRIQFKPTQTINFTRFTLKFNNQPVWNFHYKKATLTGVTNSMEAINDLNQSIINGNQNIINNQNKNQEQTNKNLEDINSSINNSEVDDASGQINDLNNNFANNGIITELITLPVKLYSKILNGVQGTCKPFVLGNLFGTELSMPCINISSFIGSTLWNIIDILISGIFVFIMSKKFIKVFDNFSTMKEGDVIQ